MSDEPAADDTPPPVDATDVEGDDSDDHTVPPELLELYEVNEWTTATAGIDPAGDQ